MFYRSKQQLVTGQLDITTAFQITIAFGRISPGSTIDSLPFSIASSPRFPETYHISILSPFLIYFPSTSTSLCALRAYV